MKPWLKAGHLPEVTLSTLCFPESIECAAIKDLRLLDPVFFCSIIWLRLITSHDKEQALTALTIYPAHWLKPSPSLQSRGRGQEQTEEWQHMVSAVSAKAEKRDTLLRWDTSLPAHE